MTKTEKYILFIDESGKSKLSDEGNYIILCGLIINKDLHAALSSYMVSLKDSSKIPKTENIHAFNLLEEEKIHSINRLTHSQIDTFFNRLSHLVQGVEMKYMIVALDKKPYKLKISRKASQKNISERTITNKMKRVGIHDFLYEGLARKLILEFAHFLESESATGEVMAESRRNGDEAVLKAFIEATQTSKYKEGTNYSRWSEFAFNRIHSLTFQNKKGLSFGLEIADLFAWGYFNNTYGKKQNSYSLAKNKRLNKRLSELKKIMSEKSCQLKNGIEKVTETKFKTLAMDRVSEFTKILEEF